MMKTSQSPTSFVKVMNSLSVLGYCNHNFFSILGLNYNFQDYFVKQYLQEFYEPGGLFNNKQNPK